MSLQGCNGMSSFRFIKYNLTKEEWKSTNHQGQIFTLEDITNNNLAIKFQGKKQEMLWKTFQSDTVIPILHCEFGTVNDQL